jgi:ubiquinone/menaquinone biosynthesis C-methylase UbiE
MRHLDLLAFPACSRSDIEADRDATLAYLVKVEHLFRQAIGTEWLTLLGLEEHTSYTLLDIGCGVGGWTLDVACRYRTMAVTGIDRNRSAIAYARTQALVRQVSNVTFMVMDAGLPLALADQTFDVITCRVLISSLVLEDWLPLLHECVRLARPGGVIYLIISERGSSTSPALEEVTALIVLALKLAGSSGSPDGRMIGMAPWLGRLLHKVGCHPIHYYSYTLDYTQGTPFSEAMSQYLEVARPVLEACLLDLGLTTPATFHTLYTQALRELRAEDFYGLWSYLAVCGITPDTTEGVGTYSPVTFG